LLENRAEQKRARELVVAEWVVERSRGMRASIIDLRRTREGELRA
jgi:hypothetical protein